MCILSLHQVISGCLRNTWGLVQVTLLCLQRASVALAGTLTMDESSPSASEMQGPPAYEILLGGSDCKIWIQMRKTKGFLIKDFDSSCLLEV